MRTQAQSGFTIIEVILFLAITGALTVGILVGSGAAIGRQRYRDSVNSFKSVLQEQYGQVSNVVSSEAENPVCTPSGGNLLFDDDNAQARGTSECLIMGRFMLVEATKVTAYNVIGQQLPPGSPPVDDTEALQNFSMALQMPDERAVTWGARIVEPETGNDSLVSILIARSPLSGLVLTYIADGDQRSNPQTAIQEGNLREKSFCVDSGGGSGMANRLAVRINARASNQSAVEIPLEEEGICG